MFKLCLFLLNLPQTSAIPFPEQPLVAKQSTYSSFASPERILVFILYLSANRGNW